MKKQIARASALVSALVMTAQVQAATVLDASTKTAVTSGFTDLKDTLLDVLGVAFPYIIGATVLLASPQIVKGLIHMAAKK